MMTGELQRNIWSKILDFSRENGRIPTCLYIGINENSELQAESTHGELWENPKTHRLQFQGVPIYVVDAQNHIRIA